MINNKLGSSVWMIFFIFLRLGLTSFGGPIAHLGYFREEFVQRRQWLTERSYADLVALCQFLPGPASSQVGIAIGLSRAGYAGALAAWLGFTLPSALALMLFATGITHYANTIPIGVLQGLKVVAVAVVAQAVWGMARHLCPDVKRISIMLLSTSFVLLIPVIYGPILVIVLCGLLGMWLYPRTQSINTPPLPMPIGPKMGLFWLGLFCCLLLGLPLLAKLFPYPIILMIDTFYRVGSLVFGGGHVVLPLLQIEVVSSGWISNDYFVAGYGITQAVPGPLFTFAAYLGTVINQSPSGWLSGVICLVAIFVPSFLLVMGSLPFWQQVAVNPHIQAALLGINAAVVGILLAALYHPIWTSAIDTPQDFVLALLALIALVFWRIPSWMVVVGIGLLSWIVNYYI